MSASVGTLCLLHDALDHRGARTHHVHLRQGQLSAPRGIMAPNILSIVFFWRLGGVRLAQRVESPEGEEHRHLSAHGQRAVGDDERRDLLVEVAREHHHRQLVPAGAAAARGRSGATPPLRIVAT